MPPVMVEKSVAGRSAATFFEEPGATHSAPLKSLIALVVAWTQTRYCCGWFFAVSFVKGARTVLQTRTTAGLAGWPPM